MPEIVEKFEDFLIVNNAPKYSDELYCILIDHYLPKIGGDALSLYLTILRLSKETNTVYASRSDLKPFFPKWGPSKFVKEIKILESHTLLSVIRQVGKKSAYIIHDLYRANGEYITNKTEQTTTKVEQVEPVSKENSSTRTKIEQVKLTPALSSNPGSSKTEQVETAQGASPLINIYLNKNPDSPDSLKSLKNLKTQSKVITVSDFVIKEWDVQNKNELASKLMSTFRWNRVVKNAWVKSETGRNYKEASKVVQFIEAQKVNQEEFIKVVKYHENKRFGNGGRYDQSWHGFAAKFDALLVEVRQNALGGRGNVDRNYQAENSGIKIQTTKKYPCINVEDLPLVPREREISEPTS